MGNVRPVSHSGTLCKLMGRLIRMDFIQYLVERSVVCQTIHGLMKIGSCLSYLMYFIDEVGWRPNEGKQEDVSS